MRRIPQRISQDLRIIRLVRNWKEVLAAKWKRKSFTQIKLRNGIQLKGPAAVDLNFLFHEIWIDKIYTPAGYEINPGDTVIDIGGNIGLFAIYAAVRKPHTKVYSFEPFPSNARFFLQNIQQNNLSRIKLYEKAVTGKKGNRFLNVSDSWVSHSLSPEKEDGKGIEVGGITLNEILEETKKCDLLKIDCEGSEYEIFYSTSHEDLQKIHRVVCEYHNNKEGNGPGLKEYFEKNSFQIDVFRKLGENTGLICATNLNFR